MACLRYGKVCSNLPRSQHAAPVAAVQRALVDLLAEVGLDAFGIRLWGPALGAG